MSAVKGWKCMDQDLKCRGHQFEIGKTYEVSGDLVMCGNGFHFHKFPCEVDRITIPAVIEVLDVTAKAKKSIDSVPVWST